ncbi:nuclear transport factor 2 family protein [Roseomonas sp. CCTCC AB2023176]|uniref:nuclear transport factor 2 family protein n=1 Tax=Roseomonas sp. CCTCC AB2023176 TaxID=3342640 RepID=UPI0035D6DFE4
MDNDLIRRLQVAELIQNWAVWRDAGDWNRFSTCWAPEGRMMATWCQAPAAGFIEASKAGWARGVSILHFLGGCSVEVSEGGAGKRAISQTKMTISQRAEVHGVLVDVVCTGRFYDFVEEKADGWKIVLRQPIYEKDRMDPVDPAARLDLDPALLARFPEGYRHLAYLQTGIGYDVKTDMPGLRGDKVQALYAAGQSWLRGDPLRWEE